VDTCIQYTYSHREGGRGGGRVDQREGEKSNTESTYPKARLKIPT
jgi:hypothetical protein